MMNQRLQSAQLGSQFFKDLWPRLFLHSDDMAYIKCDMVREACPDMKYVQTHPRVNRIPPKLQHIRLIIPENA